MNQSRRNRLLFKTAVFAFISSLSILILATIITLLIDNDQTVSISGSGTTVFQTIATIALAIFAISFFTNLFFIFRPIKNIIDENYLSAEDQQKIAETRDYLISLCTEGNQADTRPAPQYETNRYQPMAFDRPLGLIAVTIDRYDSFSALPHHIQDEVLVGIENKVPFFLGKDFQCIAFRPTGNKLLVIVFSHVTYTVSVPMLSLTLEEIQNNRLLGIDCSFIYSTRLVPADRLFLLYQDIRKALQYKFFIGWNCCLDVDRIQYPEQKDEVSQIELFETIENITTKIHKGEIQDATPYLEILRPYFGNWINYQSILLMIRNSLEHCGLSLNRFEPHSSQITPLNLDGLETTDQLKERLNSYIQNLKEVILIDNNRKSMQYTLLAEELIEKHIDDPCYGVQQMASEIGISATYLSRIYKEKTNRNLIDQITAIRMKEAARLLRETDTSLSKIHLLTGYSSNNYFYRVFHRTYGETPMEYRQKHTVTTYKKKESENVQQ